MKELFRFIDHIIKIGDCKGSKRIFYSILHIFVMALACVFAYFAYSLGANNGEIMSEHGFIVWLFAIFALVLCGFIAIICFLQGFVAQVATIVISSIYISKAEEREKNIAALVIASVSFIAVVAAIIVLFIVF